VTPTLPVLASYLATLVPFGLLIWLLGLKPVPRPVSLTIPDSWLAQRKLRPRRRVTLPLLAVQPLPPCPLTVVELAQAFTAGEDCAFALYDALLDAGLTDLAQSFRASMYDRESLAVRTILRDKRD
jgi:hypothetical protein